MGEGERARSPYPDSKNGNVVAVVVVVVTFKSVMSSTTTTMGGTWPSGQRGALACRRSQVRIPAMVVNHRFVLIGC
jgi:hypothetical protein